MKITLTDDQFNEVKHELIKELKGNYKEYLTQIIENEYDIYDEIANAIETKLTEQLIYDNLDKIISSLDKNVLVKAITESLMDKLAGF